MCMQPQMWFFALQASLTALHLLADVHTLQVAMMATSSSPVLLLPLRRPAQVMFNNLSLTLLHAS